MYASSNGQKEVVDVLMATGADIDIKDVRTIICTCYRISLLWTLWLWMGCCVCMLSVDNIANINDIDYTTWIPYMYGCNDKVVWFLHQLILSCTLVA